MRLHMKGGEVEREFGTFIRLIKSKRRGKR